MIKNTRLRSIRAKTLSDLELAVNALAFKIEIKSGPAPDGESGWFLTFVLPEEEALDFQSVELK